MKSWSSVPVPRVAGSGGPLVVHDTAAGRLRPVHPDAAAALLADAVTRGPGTPLLELAGPEEVDATAMARAVAAVRHPGVRVLGLPVPVRGLREGLLPGPGAAVDDRRFGPWVDAGAR